MSDTEKKELLKQAWKEIFEIEEVSDDADFFEDGGDSIKAVQLSSWLLQKGIKLDLGKIFYTPVLSQMAETLEETEPVYVPEEMVTKELIGEKLGDIMKNMNTGKPVKEAQSDGQICDPETMPQKEADQQICDPETMPQKGADEQICDPEMMSQQGADEQICDPEMMPQQGADEQNCDPETMPQKGADEQICDPEMMSQKGADEQICDPETMPQQGADEQNCDPEMMPQWGADRQNCDPQPMPHPAYPTYDQDFGMMTSMFQTLLQQQQVMLQMMQVMLTRKAQPVYNPFPSPFPGKAPKPFPVKAPMPFPAQKPVNMPNQIPEEAKKAFLKQMAKYQSHPVDKPIDKPNVIGIKPAKVTKPEYSAEEVLDHVLSGIFKNGYSKTEDLFEQGLTSLDTVKIVTRCGEHGYALSMQDIYMKSTFKELVQCMRPGE